MSDGSETNTVGIPQEIWLFIAEQVGGGGALRCMNIHPSLRSGFRPEDWKRINLLDFNTFSRGCIGNNPCFGIIDGLIPEYDLTVEKKAGHIEDLTLASIESLSRLGPECVNLQRLTHIPMAWLKYDWIDKNSKYYQNRQAGLMKESTAILVQLIQRNSKLNFVSLQIPATYDPFAIVDSIATRHELNTLGISGDIPGTYGDSQPNLTWLILQHIITQCRSLRTLVLGGNIRGHLFHQSFGHMATVTSSVHLNLECLDLRRIVPWDGCDLAILLPRCPNLKRLGVPSGTTPDQLTAIAGAISLNCRKIHTVMLQASPLEALSIELFLASFHRLANLGIYYCSGFHHSMLIEPLKRHAGTLLSVRLDWSPTEDSHFQEQVASLMAYLPARGVCTLGMYTVEWLPDSA